MKSLETRSGAIEAVVFDMDGLLLDSETVNCRIGTQVAGEMGFTLTQALYQRTIGRTWPVAEAIYKEYFGVDFDTVYFRTQCAGREAACAQAGGIPLKPGAVALLDWLGGLGVPLALATSTARELAQAKLTGVGLAGYFPTAVFGDMVAHSKPAPDIYLAAAAALGVPPDRCAAFEDSHAGIRAAHGAGMTAVMVPDMVPPDAQVAPLAAAILPSLEAAPAWLEDRLARAQPGSL